MGMGRIRIARKDLPRRMYFDHGAYYFRGKDNKRVTLGRDYAEAMRKYVDLVQPAPTRQRLGDVMDVYLREKVPAKRERTRADYLDAITRLRPVFGDMWPEDLEPKHVYQYLHKRDAKVRANREIAVLSNVMQQAVEMGLINLNPCRQVRRNHEPRKGGVASDAQVTAFKPYCPEWLQAYIDLKMLVGLRQGDMLTLTMFNIRDDGLFCQTSKADKGLLFAWSPALQSAVNNCKALRRKPSDQRLFAMSQNTFKAAWQYAMGKAVAGGMVRFAEKDIRSKVACEALDMGRDATTMLGHSTDAVTRRHYVRGTRKVLPLR